MQEQFSRMELLVGKEVIEKLNKSKVVVFGVGGVGSYVVEALARAGVGHFILIDNDIVSVSNINRQLIATMSTIGKYKVDVAKYRILDINPEAIVEVYKEFYSPNSNLNVITEDVSYVIDCVDTVTAKIEIICNCKKINVPVISAMGAGNKLDNTKFEITDIYKTTVCPLAKVMRKELKKRNIDSLKVVYSRADTIKHEGNVPGSISFVPSVAGLMVAGEVVKDLIK